MINRLPPEQTGDVFDDADYPAYTMGRAADMLGVTPDFLRSLDSWGLFAPDRSDGGHRRYSRAQLGMAARARELLDAHTVLSAVCRIVELEHQLRLTQAQLAELSPGQHQGEASKMEGGR